MNVNINALDDMGSLLWANNGSESQGSAYSPFGSTAARSGGDSLLPGFNGEHLDPVSQTYHLGNGYRTYNPTLMRFNAPDSWSPFGSGGLNQYAYCEGDPINRSDPSGHMSSGAAMGIGIGLGILGLLGAVFTFGQSIAAAAAAEAALTASMAADILATGLGVAASVTNIASTATRESDLEASQVLGWISLGLGIASFATHTADSIGSKFKGRSGPYDLLSDSDRAGGAASSLSKSIAMGLWEIGDVNLVETDLYTFKDVHRGVTRLNIHGHGGRMGSMGVIRGANNRLFDAQALVEELEKRSINFSDYGEIRLISCHSGVGGPDSLGQKLANYTGKPVLAYKGRVFGTAWENFNNDLAYLRDCQPSKECKRVFPIDKYNYQNHENFNYQPIWFKPKPVPMPRSKAPRF